MPYILIIIGILAIVAIRSGLKKYLQNRSPMSHMSFPGQDTLYIE